MNYSDQGLNGWLGRLWRKHRGSILSIAAGIIIGGPIGGAIGALIREAIKGNDVPLSAFEQSIVNWAKGNFDNWYLQRLKIFQGQTSPSQLLSAETIKKVNYAILEMATIIQYHKHRAINDAANANAHNAKADLIQDALTDFGDIYVSALSSIGVQVFRGKKVVKITALGNLNESVNFGGSSYSVAIPFFSKESVVNKPPPGDNPYIDIDPKPTFPDLTLPPISTGGDIVIKPTIPIVKPSPLEVVCVQSPCGATTVTQKPTTLEAAKPTNPALSNNTAQDDKVSKNVLWKALAVLGIGYAIAK